MNHHLPLTWLNAVYHTLLNVARKKNKRALILKHRPLVRCKKSTLFTHRCPKTESIFKTEHDRITVRNTLQGSMWRKTFDGCGFVT